MQQCFEAIFVSSVSHRSADCTLRTLEVEVALASGNIT